MELYDIVERPFCVKCGEFFEKESGKYGAMLKCVCREKWLDAGTLAWFETGDIFLKLSFMNGLKFSDVVAKITEEDERKQDKGVWLHKLRTIALERDI